MKVFYSLCIFFSLLFTTNVLQAQLSPSDHSSNKNKISVDLLGGVWGRVPFTSEFGVIYNRNLTPKLELSTKLAYSGINLLLRRLPAKSGGKFRDSIGVNGVALGSSIQYFSNKSDQSGLFLGLEGNYTFAHVQNKNIRSEYFNLSKFSTSLIFGFRLALLANIELDAFIGIGAAFRNYDWQKFGGKSTNNDTNNDTLNASWRIGWGMVLESSVTYATPLGLRLGYRF